MRREARNAVVRISRSEANGNLVYKRNRILVILEGPHSSETTRLIRTRVFQIFAEGQGTGAYEQGVQLEVGDDRQVYALETSLLRRWFLLGIGYRSLLTKHSIAQAVPEHPHAVGGLVVEYFNAWAVDSSDAFVHFLGEVLLSPDCRGFSRLHLDLQAAEKESALEAISAIKTILLDPLAPVLPEVRTVAFRDVGESRAGA